MMGVVAANIHDWTEAENETIRKLWSEGASASEIATEIGKGVTRNSVIGRVSRMKLPSHGNNTRRSNQPAKAKAKMGGKGHSKVNVILNHIKTRNALKAERAERGKGQMKALTIGHHLNYPAPRSLPITDELPDVTHLIPLIDLTDKTCRFPIGDPLQPSFGFCGCLPLEGSVYCPDHDAIAYHKLSAVR